jgi:hypothetical protein
MLQEKSIKNNLYIKLMLRLFKTNKTYDKCNICLDYCKKPCKLNLNCECKYKVHMKCYKKWWEENKNCIICLKKCPEPYYEKSFIHKRRRRIKTRLRIRYRNNLTHFAREDIYNGEELNLEYSPGSTNYISNRIMTRFYKEIINMVVFVFVIFLYFFTINKLFFKN